MGTGRKKTQCTKVENPQYRFVTFSKRRLCLMKKAHELGTLCGVDVGLVLFSPTGRLTTFSVNTRIEDILGKYINLPDDTRGIRKENQGVLLETLQRIKSENMTLPQHAVCGPSSSSDNIKVKELDAAIAVKEHKLQALQQQLRILYGDDDAPANPQSINKRRDIGGWVHICCCSCDGSRQ